MRRRDLLLGAGGLAGGSSLVIGSSSFSSMDADRGLQVDIVGDSEAYLALYNKNTNPTVDCGGEVNLFTIENRFSDSIDSLNVSVNDNDFSISVSDSDLDPDDKRTVTLSEDSSNCSSRTTNTTVEIEAIGDGFSVEAEREFDVEVDKNTDTSTDDQ